MSPPCYRPRPLPAMPKLVHPTRSEAILLDMLDTACTMVLEERAWYGHLQRQCGEQAGVIGRQIEQIIGLEGELAVLLGRLAQLEAQGAEVRAS